MLKARNQNSTCAMCCNPTPTEVYKHLPGFVKLLCSFFASFQNPKVFADNATALLGGLKVNDKYRTPTGGLQIVFAV